MMASRTGEVEELKRLSMIGHKTGKWNGISVKALAQDATKASCLTDSEVIIPKPAILMGKEA